MAADVTVLVCCFNQAPFVEQAVRSVLAQVTEFEVEVVVHDDASTDGTAEILQRLAEEYGGRLRLIAQAENQMSRGIVVPNQLALAARGRYVAYCDGDDYWTDPRKLDRQVAFMDASPWCAISHHGVDVVDDGGSAEYADGLAPLLAAPWRATPRLPGARIGDGNFLLTSSVMIRRSALRDEVLEACVDVWPDDFVLYALACERGDIGYLPEVMSAYRLHPSNAWAAMPAADRDAGLLQAFWFLAAHLRGPVQSAVQSRLIALLVEADETAQPPRPGRTARRARCGRRAASSARPPSPSSRACARRGTSWRRCSGHEARA